MPGAKPLPPGSFFPIPLVSPAEKTVFRPALGPGGGYCRPVSAAAHPAEMLGFLAIVLVGTPSAYLVGER